MMNKKIIILILVLAVLIVVSGCWRKEAKPAVVDNNKQVVENQKQKTATSTIAISTDGQKIYNNQKYKFEVKYPSDLIFYKNNSNDAGLILLSSDYEGDGRDAATWDEIKRGFKISITVLNIPDSGDSWIDWAEKGGGTIGENILRKEIKINDKIVYKKIFEGYGFLNEYQKKHILTEIFIPNKEGKKIAEIWMLNLKKDNQSYIKIFENLIKTFKFVD